MDTEIKVGNRNNLSDRATIREIRKLSKQITDHTVNLEPDDSDEKSVKAIPSTNPDDYLVVEDRAQSSTWHLQVKEDGAPNHRLMGAAWAALHGGFRGNKYDGPQKQQAIDKLTALYKSEKLPLPGKSVELKALTEDTATVAGWGVVYGGFDLTGDTFVKETDLGLDMVPSKSVYYDHTLGEVKTALGKVTKQEPKDEGLWIEAELDRHHEYMAMVLELVQQGALGWSSGSVGHLIQRAGNVLKRWPVVEFSLTPTPAEPRTLGVDIIKALAQSHAEYEKLLPEPETETEAGNRVPVATVGADIKTVQVTTTEDTMETKPEEKGAAPAQVTPLTDEQVTAIAKAVVSLTNAPAVQASPAYTAPAVKKVTDRGFNDDETKAFVHWVRTGQKNSMLIPEHMSPEEYKAALMEGTDAEGGYLVPADMYSKIVQKRDEVAIMRRIGAQVIPTSLHVLNIPVENTVLTKFILTAEEAAYDEAEPTFDQKAITSYKMTKVLKFSEELEADNTTNLTGYLTQILGRAAGLNENYYHFNIAANGTSQPASVTFRATALSAVASQTAITSAELLAAIYAVPAKYSDNLVMVMRRSELGAIRALAGNPFYFQPVPSGSVGTGATGPAGTIHDIPVWCTEELPLQAAANKPIVIFNPSFYAIADRQGMSVSRNPWLYQANGQIGLFASFRQGSDFLVADAGRAVVSLT